MREFRVYFECSEFNGTETVIASSATEAKKIMKERLSERKVPFTQFRISIIL